MVLLFSVLVGLFGFLTGIFYYTTESLLFTAILGALSLLLSIYISFFAYKKYKEKRFLFSECLVFMEKYIIALNTRKSLMNAFEETYQFLSKDKVDDLINIKTNFHDKIEYLGKYYRFDIYKLFKELIFEYEITGGNILDSTETLLKEISSLKSDHKFYRTQSFKWLISLGVTWLFSVAVVVVSKVAMQGFVAQVTADLTYQMLVFAGFAALLVSIFIYVKKMFSLSYIKEASNEKI